MLCGNPEGCDEVGDGGRAFRREGVCVYLWLIHVDVWERPTQHCKAMVVVQSLSHVRLFVTP